MIPESQIMLDHAKSKLVSQLFTFPLFCFNAVQVTFVAFVSVSLQVFTFIPSGDLDYLKRRQEEEEDNGKDKTVTTQNSPGKCSRE